MTGDDACGLSLPIVDAGFHPALEDPKRETY